MRMYSRFLSLSVLLLFCDFVSFAQTAVSSGEAKNHVGETATVCGQASGIHTAENAKGQPTFVNIDGRYPHNAFTIVIWGDHKEAFGDLQRFASGRVCATGKIQLFKDAPEIVVSSPDKLQKQ